MIDNNGPSFLTDEPFHVYNELLNSGVTDKKTASAILHVLAAGIDNSKFCDDTEQMSDTIRTECSLNKKMADKLSIILTSLYSENNRKEWQKKKKEGLKLFLKEDFNCTWEGYVVWDAGNGTIDCYYKAQIKLKPTDMILKDKELTQLLNKNPFLNKEFISELFEKRLQDYLDGKFYWYCTCDDYYQPVVEDFGLNLEDDIPEWCNDNGFEYISFDGKGYDGGYEPKYRHNW